uniref:Uncharacterized protein n=1 Tax=Lactuca sativa TaxID=4236 RepID=A0A9R1WKQ7_LACSA|nr:hypothetical protein LSAT_V11C100004500 [Lactuca sativa]
MFLHNFLIVEDRDNDLEDELLQEVLSAPTEEVRHNLSDAREDFITMSLYINNFNVFRSKPEAVILKTKKMQMLVLFAKDRASGENAETTKDRNDTFSKTRDIKIESVSEVDDLLASNDVTLENQRIDDDEENNIQVVSPTPDQISSTKKCKTKKRKLVDEVEEEVEPELEREPKTFETKIMNVVGDVANATREGNKIFERAYHHELTGGEIYQELQPMCLKPHEILGALMYLTRNHADARMLFTCQMNIWKDLLKIMIGTDGK